MRLIFVQVTAIQYQRSRIVLTPQVNTATSKVGIIVVAVMRPAAGSGPR